GRATRPSDMRTEMARIQGAIRDDDPLRKIGPPRRASPPRPTPGRGHSALTLSIPNPVDSRPLSPTAVSGPIGLLAGSGRFPLFSAQAARRQGLPVACVGIRYEASEEPRELCASFELVGVSKLGQMIRACRRQGVRQVVMAGKVTKNVMYTPWR